MLTAVILEPRESVITYCCFRLRQPVKKIDEWRLSRGMGGDIIYEFWAWMGIHFLLGMFDCQV